MAHAPEPPLEELLWTIAVARLLFGPSMNIQAPPNLTSGMSLLAKDPSSIGVSSMTSARSVLIATQPSFGPYRKSVHSGPMKLLQSRSLHCETPAGFQVV